MFEIPKKKIGILGGGQLARMLVSSAQQIGLEVFVYSESLEDPAAQVTKYHTTGKLDDLSKIKKWMSKLDVVTFESEFLDLSKIKSKKFAPNNQVLMKLRDRLSQKELLQNYKLPTADFVHHDAISSFSSPCVLKKRLFGYDGYGTLICKTQKSLEHHIKSLDLKDWIAESFVPFKREVAVSIGRNANNDFCVLPLVESFQKEARCFWVKGPTNNPNLPSFINKAKKFLTGIQYVGIMAFELFETQEGKLLVNEIAPRVHNSAHYSIEALTISQFRLHLMSILNMKLPKTLKPTQDFAMVNLIGSSKKRPSLFASQTGHLHWYDKKDNRPGRKMGHMTFLDKDQNKALKLALKAEKKQEL